MSLILIQGGTVVDPLNRVEGNFDVLVKSGKVMSIRKHIKLKRATLIKAKGQIVMPGLIDIHVHLRDFEERKKGTIASETAAAAAGGFTTVLAMPNTRPPLDSSSAIKRMKKKIQEDALVNVLIAGTFTRGRKGMALADVREMAEAGASALTDDGSTPENALLFERAVRAAARAELLVMDHAELARISGAGVMNAGATAVALGVRGKPVRAFSEAVARDIVIAARTHAHIHITHVADAESIRLIRAAKQKRIPITCDTTPHYLALTEERVKKFGGIAKVNPPLMTERDRAAVLEGLTDGTIDAIVTDHAPHLASEKKCPLEKALPGIAGLETSFGVAYTHLVQTKLLTLKQLIVKMSVLPAYLVGIRRGRIAVGDTADITIANIRTPWVVRGKSCVSKTKLTPFEGMKLKGKITTTIRNGEIIFSKGLIRKT